jgi:methylated-DNA-[protein]-cysteine S-methyltransferase
MNFLPIPTRCNYASPLGPMVLAAQQHALVGVWFDGQQHQPEWAQWPTNHHHPVLVQTAQQLDAYFAGTLRQFDLPLDMTHGTPFQQSVWRALCDIEAGGTVSYGTISQRIGKPKAVRAVGAAIGRNPLGIVVPCHRVVGANGALTGYAGGLDKKIALLQLESRF